MAHSETVTEDVADCVVVEEGEDNIELIETIEPGSVEWFRLHAPLPLLFEALLENPNFHSQYAYDENETAKSACKHDTDFWNMLFTAEQLAELFVRYDDPNAKAIVARLRMLTGCEGRLTYTG